MKTSSIFVGLAIATGIATLATANLKIKSEYTKGNLQSAYNRTKLPPFRYIKETVDSTARVPFLRFQVTANAEQEPSVSTYFVRPLQLSYKVINDTLFISSLPVDKDDYTVEPILISTPVLNGLQATRGLFEVGLKDVSSFSVSTFKTSQVGFSADKINTLSLTASENSVIRMKIKETVEEAAIRVSGWGVLHVNNTVMNKKTVQLDSTVTVQLYGKSVANFGVK